ncbi:hypothetical protein BV20DRAFT_978379 [Pilatotrama ljubarskyi]|nr:hypothetical protein BV20DRAFT_978379 [Pilatotrama ljubarskyi]
MAGRFAHQRTNKKLTSIIWGPIIRQDWWCPHCNEKLRIQVVDHRSRPNYGRCYVTVHPCEPLDYDGTPLHEGHFEWCNYELKVDTRETPPPSVLLLHPSLRPSAPLKAPSPRRNTPPTVAATLCTISDCPTRSARGCFRSLCSRHCPLIGGCLVHQAMSRDELYQLGLTPIKHLSTCITSVCVLGIWFFFPHCLGVLGLS